MRDRKDHMKVINNYSAHKHSVKTRLQRVEVLWFMSLIQHVKLIDISAIKEALFIGRNSRIVQQAISSDSL